MIVRRGSAVLILALFACKVENKPPAADTTGSSDPKVTSTAAVGTGSVVGARIAVPHAGPPGEWQMPAGDYASSRYSELASITPQNVANLHVAWAFSTGVLRGHEGQPLVIGNTMYVVTPYPNVSYALDLTQEGQPLKWKARPVNAQTAVGLACCDVVNRGASFADGRIFYNLLDGHTVAVDVATGTQVWRTKMGDLSKGETITMAPPTKPHLGNKMKRKTYEKELRKLQVRLCQLQDWVKETGARIIVVFEGRDAAGKGGTIKALTERVSPRVIRTVALPAT